MTVIFHNGRWIEKKVLYQERWSYRHSLWRSLRRDHLGRWRYWP